jgi:dihydrofolate reductase
MSTVRVHNLSISLDGYVAGPDQAIDRPLGAGGMQLHEWVFAEPRSDLDRGFIVSGDAGIGATVMGRNMFGPIRGPWPDESWTGWWGDVPPFHHPVFVLTHHARPPVEMAGGTTFHFVTDGPMAALQRAIEVADGADVRIGGGASTLRQYLRAGVIDELHLAIVPVLLGAGERLFEPDAGVGRCDFECVEHVSSPSVTHVVLVRRR